MSACQKNSEQSQGGGMRFRREGCGWRAAAGALGWARSRTESRNEACDCIQDSPRVLRFPRIFETAVVKVVAGNTDQTRT